MSKVKDTIEDERVAHEKALDEDTQWEHEQHEYMQDNCSMCACSDICIECGKILPEKGYRYCSDTCKKEYEANAQYDAVKGN